MSRCTQTFTRCETYCEDCELYLVAHYLVYFSRAARHVETYSEMLFVTNNLVNDFAALRDALRRTVGITLLHTILISRNNTMYLLMGQC